MTQQYVRFVFDCSSYKGPYRFSAGGYTLDRICESLFQPSGPSVTGFTVSAQGVTHWTEFVNRFFSLVGHMHYACDWLYCFGAGGYTLDRICE